MATATMAHPPPTNHGSHTTDDDLAGSCTRSMSGSSLTIGRTLYHWFAKMLAPGESSADHQPRRSRRPSNEYAPAALNPVDIVVSPTKQRRTSAEPPSAAPTAHNNEALPPRKAARSPPTVVSASKLAPPPATAPPPPKRELSTRSYVIGGLNFEVDSRYKIKSIVGKGAYGLVCAAEDLCPAPEDLNSPKQADPAATTTATPPAADDKKAPAMVAVKKVIDPFHDHTDCKRLLREIRLLRCLRHPNVLHLTDIMPAKSPSPDDWKDVYLVTRLFDTNLHRVIYSGHALTDAHIQYILWQVFRALRYLHAAGVVHRDMKPTNLLLNRDCELALADFGLARYMPQALLRTGQLEPNAPAVAASPSSASSTSTDGSPTSSSSSSSSGKGSASATATGSAPPGHQRSDSTDSVTTASAPPPERSKAKGGQLTKYVVTRWYRAPELLVQNRQYDFKVDMWSTGCILAEVLGAKAIFPGKDSLHQLRLVVEMLGLPTDDELSTIHNQQAVSYIRNLRPKEQNSGDPEVTAAKFQKLYPHASPLLVDLMARLLQFDPRKRPTAAEALDHPYLAAYRDAPEEGLPTPEIEMNFEAEGPSTDELRMHIWDEVLRYHPHAGQGNNVQGPAKGTNTSQERSGNGTTTKGGAPREEEKARRRSRDHNSAAASSAGVPNVMKI